MFTNAIVRRPGANFADGLTRGVLGTPVYKKTLEQHKQYCRTLQGCGVAVLELEPDVGFPDSTFVEDTAVLVKGCAILTRPGASTRIGEVAGIREPISRFFRTVHEVSPPGTVDGGDVCKVEDRFFIGISHRTNENGAKQLAGFLSIAGYDSSFIDVREFPGLLHLKSGLSYLGDNNLVVVDDLIDCAQLRGLNLLPIPADESYSANCVRINEHVIVPDKSRALEDSLNRLGYSPLSIDISEFQKMDGGLSCLSLRF